MTDFDFTHAPFRFAHWRQAVAWAHKVAAATGRRHRVWQAPAPPTLTPGLTFRPTWFAEEIEEP